MPRPATANAPRPADMPSPISRNRIVTSFGSSTGVRNRMMLAAPAMPNARASELPMMIIISAPDTQSSICACSIDRLPWTIARRGLVDGRDQACR